MTAWDGTHYVNGQMSRNTGFPTWPWLQPGANDLTWAPVSGSTGVTIQYQKAGK